MSLLENDPTGDRRGASADPVVTTVTTVADLTAEHRGWLITVVDPNPLLGRRSYVLGPIRRWTYKRKTTVGLVDTSDATGNVIGTERHYPPDTPCELVRRVSRSRPRRSR